MRDNCLLVGAEDYDTIDDDDDDDDMYTPAPVPITNVPTYTPTQILYYVAHFSGKCTDATQVPMPHYILSNETFTNYKSCCEFSFLEWEACMEDAPYLEPTASPSDTSTEFPTVSPTVVPSEMPSVPTVRPTEEECGGVVWRYDSEYVNGCTNLDIGDENNNNESSGNGNTSYMLFQSWVECCQRFFLKGKDCQIDDQCKIEPTMISFEDRPQTIIQESCTESHELGYHPDQVNKDGCTNSNDVPDSWTALEDTSSLFFASALECCTSLYFDKGYDCTVRNVCADVVTEALSSGSSMPAQEVSGTQDEAVMACCNERKWHPDTNPTDGCSNSMDYPEEWNDDNVSLMMLFDTAELCCAQYGLECNVDDTCSNTEDTSPSSAECISAKWHPAIGDDEACSNSPDYPPSWDAPEMASYILLDSFEECCERHLPDVSDCRKDDVCASSSSSSYSANNEETSSPSSSQCISAKWHPATGSAGGQDDEACSNSPDYPPSWDTPGVASYILLDTFEECCERHYPDVADCRKDDVCASSSSSSNGNSSGATTVTTATISTSTTVPPCSAKKWHPSEDFSR